MSNERPIIIQQTQSQTQNGCCAGTGCGTLFAIGLALVALGAWLEAVQGVHGTGWQVGTILGTVVLAILLIAGGFAALDQRFGWGYTTDPNEPEPEQRNAADIIVEDELNYGTATPTESESAQKLRQLRDLRDQGLITPEEFDAKREEILKNL